MATREMEVRFVGNDTDLSNTTKRVRRDIDSTSNEAEKSGGRFKSGFTVAKGAVASFAGNVAANFAGTALTAVKDFAVQSVTAASDMQETLSKSNAIFGPQAREVERWANSAATNFGLAKSEALDYAAGLGDMASQIGFTGKESAAFGQDLVQVSADLGSFNNLETGDVLDRISAALRGEYDSLQAVIPNINAARVEQEALALSGKATAKELTAQEKALAVQAILHKDGARAMGDFAKTSGGFANQQKIAAAQVQTLQERLGQVLLPILTAVMGFLTTTAIPALAEFAGWFGDQLAPKIGEFAAGLSGVLPVLQSFGGFLAANAGWLLPLATGIAAIVAAVRIWTGVQAALNLVMSANPIGLVVIAIGALVAGLIYAYQNSETFRNIVNTAFEAVKFAVTAAISAIIAAFNAVVAWFQRVWSTAQTLNARIVSTFVAIRDGVIKAIRTMINTVLSTISSWVNRTVQFVVNLRDRFVRANQQLRDLAVRAFVQLRDRVVGFVKALRDRVVRDVINLRDRAFSAFRSLRDGAANIVSGLRERVVAIVNGVRSRVVAAFVGLRDRAFSAFRSLRDGAGTIFSQVRDWIVNRVSALRSNVSRIAWAVRDNALKPFRSLRDVGVKIFTGFRDTIGRVMNGILDKIKSPLRTAFSWLNSNLIKPLNSVTSKFGLNIPELPKFHKGGMIPGRGEMPIMALGGEGMLNRRAMAMIGGERGLARMNKGEGFGGPGDWLKNFSEFISKPTELLARMATEGAKWAVSQVLGAIPAIPTTGVPLVDGLPKLFNAMKSGALSWAGKQQQAEAAELGANAGGPIGSGPWVKPVGAGIGTGYLGYPGHYGVDFPVGMNTPVHAVSNGVITKAASLTYSYGRHLMMRHADGLVTLYAHLNRLSASVGQSVKTGQVIGYSGTSGNSTGPHLHYETRVGGGYPGPNPRGVMRARGVTLDTGGMLQPGLTLVRNATGQPEPVLNPSQWRAIKSGGNAQPVVINIYGAVDKAAAAREIKQLLESDSRRSSGVKIMRGSSRG